MAKEKYSSRRKPERRSWLAWRLILAGTIVALFYWQWATLVSWATGVASGAVRLFDWGLVFIVIVTGTLLGLLWRRKLLLLWRYWHQWLGSIALILAIWGILAFLKLGGNFGLSIIGYPAPDFVDILIGILRIAGLVILGVILVAPRTSFRLITQLISWLGKQWPRRLARLPTTGQERSVPSLRAVPQPPVIETRGEKMAIATAAPTQQELKQVAQEVWKRYGESPGLVTVDGWRLPPIDILDGTPEADNIRVEFGQQEDNLRKAKIIEEALASYGVEAKVVQINAGPATTQFGVEPGWDRRMREIRERDKDGNVRVRHEEVSKTRVKVERITSLANDLTLALAAPSIRIEAPVPGKSVVGIEVPNIAFSLVSLRGVIETSTFQKILARSKLSLALGKGAGGEAVAADLSRMPHLLIAGATGSGKTVCLNSTICCLLLHNTPYDTRFIMIDPKRVELTMFNSIPHLIAPVVVANDKALASLRWLNQEMDERYQKLAAVSVRNIEGYNRNRQGEGKMPYLVLVIDELADLMMAGGDEVEHILCRLAQLSRAVGIHLVVATQRPSVDVVTGLIKANFPTRVSFAVTSQVDSRTILDTGGAEKLLGRGDMLYMPTEASKPKRLQGCFVSDAEAERLVYFWGSQRREETSPLKVEELVPSQAARKGGYPEDSLLEAARQLARVHGHISTSFLQRRLRIGYPRAARIMEQLEEEKEKGEGGEL